ncbi:MAG: hypothetical protein JSR48_14815 [Verrucomicrobia bacterium]|nr:hypothetical protein [Verrucomicrobiota bacterium]
MPLPRSIVSSGRALVRAVLAAGAGICSLLIWLFALLLTTVSMSLMEVQDDESRRLLGWIPRFAAGLFAVIFLASLVVGWRRKWGLARMLAWEFVLGSLLLAVGTLLVFARTTGALEYYPNLPFAVAAIQVTAILALLGFARWSQWEPSRFLILSLFMLSPLLSWLSLDEPAVRQPRHLSDVVPAEMRDPAARELALRYTSQEGKASVRRFHWPRFLPGLPPRSISTWEPYVARLLKQRTELEASWAAIAPEREWVADLDTRPVITDLPMQGAQVWQDPKIALPPFDVVINLGCAKALVLATDGKGDEAAALLTGLLSAVRKFDASALTYQRYFTARRELRQVASTVRYVLARVEISSASRAALAAACGDEQPDLTRLRRFFDAQYANLYEVVFDQSTVTDPFGKAFYNVARLVYNPNTTVNELAVFTAASRALAEKGDLVALERAERHFRRGRLKNFGGAILLDYLTFDARQVTQRFWESEDERRALARELRAG